MPECEWCAGFSVDRLQRVPNPGWVRGSTNEMRARRILYVCWKCARVLEGAAKEEARR